MNRLSFYLLLLLSSYSVAQAAPLEKHPIAVEALFSIYDLKLPLLAYHGFIQNFAQPTEERNDKNLKRILHTISKIHSIYPSLKYPENILQFSAEKSRDPEEIEIITSIAARKLSEQGTLADIKKETEILHDNNQPSLFIHGQEFLVHGLYQKAIENHEKLLQESSLQKLETKKDGLLLNLARAHYNLKNYESAQKYFQKVSTESNLFPEALLGLAWTYLIQGNTSKAVGTAYNLMTGNMKYTFHPEAPIIVALALAEKCNYMEALTALRNFRKTYDPAYQWLYHWKRNQGNKNQNLYSLLTSAEVPINIRYEWMHSPVFLALQAEINELFIEKEKSATLLTQLGLGIPSNQIEIFNIISSLSEKIPEIQKAIVNRINEELAFLNRRMLAQWVDAFENSQSIQIELFESMGTDIIHRRRSLKSPIVQNNEVISHDSNGLPTLEWGKITHTRLEDDLELWSDENGFLMTNIQNKCINTK